MLRAPLIALVFLSAAFSSYGQITVSNPSFEGTSAPHTVPSPWSTCQGSGTPDTQPGQWGITLAPSHGSTYVSFLYDGSGSHSWIEGATQQLSAPFQAGVAYDFTVDLAFSPVYNTASPNGCYGSFEILAGNGACPSSQSLYQSGPITHATWQTYTIQITPNAAYTWISFRPYYITSCGGYINIMVDNMQPITIFDPCLQWPLGGNVSTVGATCNTSNGSASMSVSGGTSPFVYDWSTGQTGSSALGLGSGSYSVTVTDANNCTMVRTFHITDNGTVSPSISVTNETCSPGNNGVADLTLTGGTPPYSYTWSNGQTTQDASGLSAGNYIVTIVDANSCTGFAFATVGLGSPGGLPGIWTWVGTYSDDWHDPCNWDKLQVPDAASIVLIPGATVNNPVIHFGSGHCYTIEIAESNNADLTISQTLGAKLTVHQP